MRPCGAGDTDTADGEGSQRHQFQMGRQPVDEARQAGIGPVEGAGAPALGRPGRLQRRHRGGGGDTGRQQSTGHVARDRARRIQPRPGQPGLGDHNPRPEREAEPALIGLGDQPAADGEIGPAQLHDITRGKPQPRKQGALGQQPVGPQRRSR